MNTPEIYVENVEDKFNRTVDVCLVLHTATMAAAVLQSESVEELTLTVNLAKVGHLSSMPYFHNFTISLTSLVLLYNSSVGKLLPFFNRSLCCMIYYYKIIQGISLKSLIVMRRKSSLFEYFFDW